MSALGAGVGIGFASAADQDDRATTETVLREVASSPRKSLADEMVSRSRQALDRGAKLRSSGDEPHARLADGLARTWAEAARDVVKAAEAEEKAAAARLAATDAGAQADRERALLEESIAQSGRLRAQLEQLERESKEQPAKTSTSANQASDGGAAKPKAPPKAAPAKDGGAR
ncbi:hypothetical protein AKJ09_10144 [Labilithrix luteola]|uniref:Uncharacterized protein n=1 Tax=Labilithrix luteola TaxID=1391654 RepID=A0A0K1QCH3_9BACT|nr:hypothetical protein AKJ09_10144 [Labilithrix luteola]